MPESIAPVSPQKRRCPCGGTLRQIRFARYPLNTVGIDVVLVGKIVGHQCGGCRHVTVADSLVKYAIDSAVLKLLRLNRRLAGQEAAFLRHAVLGYDITGFAQWRGRSRSSIHRYEGARSLPDNEDFVLRGLVLGHLIGDSPDPNHVIDRVLLDVAKFALKAPRHDPAPTRLELIEIRMH